MLKFHQNEIKFEYFKTNPFVIFYDVFADAGQSSPLAIVDGLDGAPFVRFEFADFATQAVRCDA